MENNNNNRNNELITDLKERITAKLESIGNNTRDDDTLLDYILVMVVNQKTKFEMKHNLSLFLSRNTEEFVDWLFELLAEARENTIPSTTNSVPEVASAGEKKEGENKQELVQPTASTSPTMKKKQPTTKRQLRSAVISTVLKPNEQSAGSHNKYPLKRKKSFSNDLDKRKVIKGDEKGVHESHSESEKPDDVKENKVNSTKFYVTLNGVKDIYKDDLILMDDEELDPELVEEEAPEEEEEEQDSQGGKNAAHQENMGDKINERCKYWPSCLNGQNCEFFHPTVKCKKFPYCPFGDKCLFIHPPCKFDTNCTRQDCSYTHTVKPRAVVQEAQVVVCKFFPKCMNRSCEFYHPKVCHYGPACKAPYCPYAHPFAPPVHYQQAPSAIYPKRSLLKWKPAPGRLNSNEIEID